MTLTPRGLGVSSDFWDRKQLEYKESFGRAWLTFNHLENLHSILQKKQHSSDLKNKHTNSDAQEAEKLVFISLQHPNRRKTRFHDYMFDRHHEIITITHTWTYESGFTSEITAQLISALKQTHCTRSVFTTKPHASQTR